MAIIPEQLYRKLAWRLLPPMYCLYVLAYLDRMNVGLAQLQMRESLHFSDTVYGFGAGIFFLGYTLFEIPSNLCLERFGAKVWLTRIMITWGIISSLMVFIETPLQFYILRFLLGIAEAGSFPGLILYFSYWFPAPVRAKYGAILITATAVSGLIGAPLAGTLLSLDGYLNWQGWQWLFLAEGIPSIVLGFCLYFWLTDRPASATWLTMEEKIWLQSTLNTEQAASAHSHAHGLKQALLHPKVWLLGMLYFTVVLSYYSISLWLPLIIKSVSGFNNVQTAWLTAVPYLLTVIVMVLVGTHSDRTQERKWHIAVCGWLGALSFGLSPYQTGNPALALLMLSIAAACIWSILAPFWTLPHNLLKEGPAKASGLALINSIGNLGGFAGPYAVGWLKQQSGGFILPADVLSAILALGVILVFFIAEPDD